uniref:Uncharacterized protein n=1 Tax=Triticum urartu TaxID=4572 RepID=A0A8R7Q222_TRIUA
MKMILMYSLRPELVDAQTDVSRRISELGTSV